MKMTDFELLVKYMRIAQKSYFETRHKDWLQKSKFLELAVDKYLDKRSTNQKSMFNEE